MEHYGDFGPDEPEWNAQARLEEKLLAFARDTFGAEPGISTLRENLVPMLARWRASKAGK